VNRQFRASGQTYGSCPLNVLHAFEAAARHISVKEATAELSATPDTVSRWCPGWRRVPEPVALPFDGSIVAMSANAVVSGVVLRMQSWTRSPTVFAYNPVTRQFADTGIAPPSPISFAGIE
jgi:hypothetical protein